MSTQLLTLASLMDARISVVSADRAPLRLVPGGAFRTPVRLMNEGTRPIAWTAERTLHLAYRWVGANKDYVERDGIRTKLHMPIEPQSIFEVNLRGEAPSTPGDYECIISLVLEGVHWACDISSSGWTTIAVSVADAPPWPPQLQDSSGAKALRGAIAAHALSQRLAERRLDRTAISGDGVAPAQIVFAKEPSMPLERPPLGRRLRAWLRHLLGIPEMRDAVEELLRRTANQHEELTQVAVAVAEIAPLRAHFSERNAAIDEKLARLASQGATVDRINHRLNGIAVRLNNQRKAFGAVHGAVERLPMLIASEATQSRDQFTTELRGSPVMVELTASLRQIADWARDAGDLGLSRILESAVRQLSDRIDAGEAQQLTYLRDLQRHATANSAKLDGLIVRETIPVAGAGLVLSRSRRGLLAIQDDDQAAVAYYSSGELPERGTVALVEAMLEPGDTFLDVGANVGAYCLVGARAIAPSGKVIAVEPMPSTARMLDTTIAINGIANLVEAHRCALGAESARAAIYPGATSGHSSLIVDKHSGAKAVEVEVRRGMEILDSRVPKLVKIDVEGWELEVIEGLRPLVESAEVALIVECSPGLIRRKDLSVEAWFQQLRGLGKEIWVIDNDPPALRPLKAARDIGDDGANLFLAAALPACLRDLLA